MAVPQVDFRILILAAGQNALNIVFKRFSGAQAIGACGDGDGPLGVGPQGQTRNTQVGGFFLDTSGVGQGKTAVEHQVHKPDVV